VKNDTVRLTTSVKLLNVLIKKQPGLSRSTSGSGPVVVSWAQPGQHLAIFRPSGTFQQCQMVNIM